MKKTEAQKLREKATGIRLDAYYKHGGVGAETLKAEAKAKALDERAAALDAQTDGTKAASEP
jgi:hypothetical protein